MHEALRDQVFQANLALAAQGLAHGNFGNVSAVDRDAEIVAIKPSGVPYSELRAEGVSLVALESGEWLDGLKPSSDAPTHLELYRAFVTVGGIAHTHSTYATSWAQALRPLPCLGTTHADFFNGAVPCTRPLREEECGDEYERLTGAAIVDALAGIEPLEMPAVLVSSHGPFAWGVSASDAVEHATALEVVARMAFNAVMLNASLEAVSEALLERRC